MEGTIGKHGTADADTTTPARSGSAAELPPASAQAPPPKPPTADGSTELLPGAAAAAMPSPKTPPGTGAEPSAMAASQQMPEVAQKVHGEEAAAGAAQPVKHAGAVASAMDLEAADPMAPKPVASAFAASASSAFASTVSAARADASRGGAAASNGEVSETERLPAVSPSKPKTARRASHDRDPKRTDLEASIRQPPGKQSVPAPATSGPANPASPERAPKLDLWRCVRGQEQWSFEGAPSSDDDGDVDFRDRNQIAKLLKGIDKTCAELEREWATSENMVASCAGDKANEWTQLLNAADKRKDGMASASRLLMLLETAVETAEMGKWGGRWTGLRKVRLLACRGVRVASLAVGNLTAWGLTPALPCPPALRRSAFHPD